MIFEEKAIKSEKIFNGKVINVKIDTILLPGGGTATREVVEHSGGVTVAALDKGELILVRQFRYPLGKALYEMPAGKLSPGEDPRLCGIRELMEETGAKARRFEKLGEIYPSPGFSDEVLHIYYAADLTFSSQRLDPDEYLDMVRMPVEKVFEMAKTGLIKDAKTIAGLYYLLMRPELLGKDD